MKTTMMLFLLAISTQVLEAKSNSTNSSKALVVQEYKMEVTEDGYVPASLKVKAKTPIRLLITRKTNGTCAREIVLPNQKIKVNLPLNKEVTMDIPGLDKGEIRFGCAMDLMISGVIHAE